MATADGRSHLCGAIYCCIDAQVVQVSELAVPGGAVHVYGVVLARAR
jgi:hypothetical protein